MSFFKKVWGAVKKIAPVAIGYAVGGPAGAAIGGGLGSAARGGDLSQILQGASYGFAGGNALAGLTSAAAGAGLSGAGAQSAAADTAFNSALAGNGTFSAANAIANGGIPGAIANAAPGLYNAGSSVGNFLSNPVQGITNLASKGVNSLSSLLSGGGSPATAPGVGTGTTVAGAGAGGGTSAFGGNNLLNVLSGVNNLSTEKKAEDQLLEQQRQNLALNKPYLESGAAANTALQSRLPELTARFNPGDLTQDPGYKFQLEQGTQAMNRANAAAGSLDSGEALKAAQEFGTGLADQTYNAAFTRWLQNNAQNYDVLAGQQGVGVNAANTAAGYNTNIGNVKANATVAKGNTLTGTLSSLLSGAGAKRVVGYKTDGTAIYA